MVIQDFSGVLENNRHFCRRLKPGQLSHESGPGKGPIESPLGSLSKQCLDGPLSRHPHRIRTRRSEAAYRIRSSSWWLSI